MKPSDFILNSDYLSLARIDKSNFNQTIPSLSVAAQGRATKDFFISLPNTQIGAIDRYFFSVDSSDYFIGSTWTKYYASNTYISIFFDRTGSNQIRVRVNYYNFSASSYTFPSYSLAVKVSTFKPPNIT